MTVAIDARPELAEDRNSAGKITLPPPDWTGPKVVDDRVCVEAPPPLERRVDVPLAPEGALRAELLAAHAAQDTTRERAAATRLSRWLAAQGRSWDEALNLARVALELGEDGSLRHELAGWLEGLGDAAAAAEALEPLATAGTRDPVETVRLLLHMGVLQARAGNPRAAAASFARAARIEPGDALASELLGTLASWAPSAVTASEAAESYVEAAGRRLSARAFDAQMDDLLRAFDVDPTSSVAVAALAAALTERGRPLGADEVWRAHAAALRTVDEKRSRSVHARRRLQARASGDLARALGAALDEGLDAVFGNELSDFMDDLLLRCELLEPLVARLEIRAESAPRATRAALYEEIARLQVGPLANSDRAAAARVVALETDPTREDTLAAIRAHATETRDATELVEALIRAVQAPEDAVPTSARHSAARALAVIADEALGDPTLSAWALGVAGEVDRPTDPARAEALIAALDERERLKLWLGWSDGEERVAVLRSLAGLLRSRPDEAALNSQVLAELVDLLPAERRWYAEAVRLAFRRRDYSEVIRLSRAVRERPAPLQDLVDAAVVEATARRALQDFAGANETTRVLVTKAQDDPRALSVAWMNAALAGDHETRSTAIEHLAKFAGASVRAVLYAVASEARVVIGDRETSRRLAERACQTDPSSARAVGTLAEATVGAHDRTAVSALERGIHFLFARSSWCRALAATLDAMGESSYAVGWTQRLVALRPGDRKAMAALLERVARTRDGAELAEALIWVLARPQPAAAVIELVVSPLRDLIAIDTGRAVLVARRALDAFGACLPGPRDAILAAADAAGDVALAVATLERAVAVEDAENCGALLGSLRERQQRAGDVDGEARTLLAIARTAPDDGTLPGLEALGQVALSSDGELDRLEALVHLTVRAGSQGDEARQEAIRAWRDLGAARWDLAGDQEGAQRSLERAAALDPTGGFTTLVFDLAQLGGASYALDSIERRIQAETSDTRAALIASRTSRVALALGEPSRAFDFAVKALARDPELAEALEIAESAATASQREVEMTRVYDELTVRALGRFGRRAVNYRGARFFEQQGDNGLALKHAVRAFQAVPSEGAALTLLVRTAQRAGDWSQAVEAMIQVAETTEDVGARFGWLMRAAGTAGVDEQGLALRVDVLLRALAVSGDPRAAIALQLAAEQLLRGAPDERASLELRLGRASRTATAKAVGSNGARLALAFARMALELFDDVEWASATVASALQTDGDVDDYATLLPRAAELAQAASVETLYEVVLRPYANIGVAACRLLARIAEIRGEGSRAADLWTRAVARDPEDAELVRTADAAVRASGGDEQWARLRKAVPDDERAQVFHAFAEARLREGSTDEALRALERAVELAIGEEREALDRELRAAYEASGRAERMEEHLLAEATDQGSLLEDRARRWAEVAQLREARGDLGAAVEALAAAAALDSDAVEHWSALERVAEAAGRDDVRLDAIRQMIERVAPSAKSEALKRLARAFEARDEFGEAEATWRRVAEADPDDEDADHAIEALISAQRNYADLALHLERRIARLAKAPGAREALRAVRLRRAAILEQRLGRTRDACAELALVLDDSPDNVSALSYLADLHERLGEFASAAPIWRRVAMLARDASAQSDFGIRAGRAAMMARDFTSALACAKEVISREPDRREALELRVSAAHALRDDGELGEALDAIAVALVDDPRARSDALMEASHAATRTGREHLALQRARRAAEAAPERAATQVLARMLEYRLRGVGTVEDARMTLAAIDGVTEVPSRDETVALAFLRAEALEVTSGTGSGLVVLRGCQAVSGPHPLLSLGVAERLLATGDFAGALPEFEAALAGDLGGVRDRGRVALAAAETAIRAGREDAALALFQDAAGSIGLRTTALLRAARLLIQRGEVPRARGVLSELATSTAGDDWARVLAELARIESQSADPGERGRAVQTFEKAIAAATGESPLAAQLGLERDALAPPASQPWEVRNLEAPSYAHAGPVSILDARPEAAGAQPLASTPPAESPPEPSASPAATSPGVVGPAVTAADPEGSTAVGATPEEKASVRLGLAKAYLEKGAQDAAQSCLEAGLEEGGVEEGELLASLYQSSGRLGEVVRVRRRLVALAPGDRARLEALRAAAGADRNPPYEMALDHVARTLDPGASPVAAPALSAQVMLPGFLAFLTRAVEDWVAQALALVWEDGHSTWVKEATGALDGARPASASRGAVASLYETAISLLALPRVPLFLRPSEDPPSPHVALTWPAVAIVSGRLDDDSPELRFALGQALALALPPNVLAVGLGEAQARNTFRAVMGAFGPPEASRAMNRESGRLAEALWHVLLPRTQRRLQMLLGPVQLADSRVRSRALVALRAPGRHVPGG